MKRVVSVTLLVLLSLLTASCGTSTVPGDREGGTREKPAGVSGAQQKALRLVWSGQLTPLWHPAAYQTFSQTVIFYLVFNNLVKLDEDLKTILPDLAESWEVSPDGKVYTFYLREGVRWHDGTPFAAKDVIFSFSRQLLEPYRYVKYMEVVEGAQGYKEGKTRTVDGLELINPSTVRVVLSTPNVNFLMHLTEPTCVIVPQHLLKDVNPNDIESSRFATTSPVGTGPYKFVRYVTDQFVELSANPEYFKGRPQINQIFMKELRPEVTLAQLESGEVDLALRLNPMESERLSKLPNLNLYSTSGIGSYTLLFPIEQPRVRDKRVRQAIYYAVDRPAMVKAIFQGRARVLRGAPPALDHYEDLNPYPYDPEKAKQLLQEADFDFDAPFRIMYDQTLLAARQVYPIVGQQLQRIGMNVQLDAVDTTNFLTRGQQQRDSYDMNGVFGGAEGLGPHQTATYYNCEKPGWLTGYLNCEFDELFARASRTLDPQKRDELYHQAARIFNEDLPHLPLWAAPGVHAATNRLSGGFAIYRDAKRSFTKIETWTLD